MPKVTPIITLHDGYIRVILEHKIIAIDLESEEVEEFVRKSRNLNTDTLRDSHKKQ